MFVFSVPLNIHGDCWQYAILNEPTDNIPSVRCISPNMALSKDDLPEPIGPVTAENAAHFIFNVSPWSIAGESTPKLKQQSVMQTRAWD
jgi:hypothetical protein